MPVSKLVKKLREETPRKRTVKGAVRKRSLSRESVGDMLKASVNAGKGNAGGDNAPSGIMEKNSFSPDFKNSQIGKIRGLGAPVAPEERIRLKRKPGRPRKDSPSVEDVERALAAVDLGEDELEIARRLGFKTRRELQCFLIREELDPVEVLRQIHKAAVVGDLYGIVRSGLREVREMVDSGELAPHEVRQILDSCFTKLGQLTRPTLGTPKEPTAVFKKTFVQEMRVTGGKVPLEELVDRAMYGQEQERPGERELPQALPETVLGSESGYSIETGANGVLGDAGHQIDDVSD